MSIIPRLCEAVIKIFWSPCYSQPSIIYPNNTIHTNMELKRKQKWENQNSKGMSRAPKSLLPWYVIRKCAEECQSVVLEACVNQRLGNARCVLLGSVECFPCKSPLSTRHIRRRCRHSSFAPTPKFSFVCRADHYANHVRFMKSAMLLPKKITKCVVGADLMVRRTSLTEQCALQDYVITAHQNIIALFLSTTTTFHLVTVIARNLLSNCTKTAVLKSRWGSRCLFN